MHKELLGSLILSKSYNHKWKKCMFRTGAIFKFTEAGARF